MSDTHTSFYRRHRFQAEIIAEAVLLCFRFPLSFRMNEDMFAYRGIFITHKTVREWAAKFRRDYANKIHHRTPGLGAERQLDEVVVPVKGEKHVKWRAVDQDEFMLGVLVQKKQ